MKNKNLILLTFILVALAQLYVPAKMILDREAILKEGTAYKFKAAPVDPNDILRGKYIILDYEENEVELPGVEDWSSYVDVFLTFTTDQEGYAVIQSVSKEKFTDTRDYLKATLGYVTTDSLSTHLSIFYPFNRYYMEESKAYDAELAYRESLIDTSKVTYALVNIKDGEAVLRDVLIDDVSIREIVKQKKDEK